MSKPLLDPRKADLLVKIAGLFGSDQANERAVAAAKADAFVRRHGLTQRDVISGISERQPDVAAFSPGWRQMAHTCGVNAHRLRPREVEFISDMLVARRPPTARQLDWLTSLYERISDDVAQCAGNPQ